MEHNPYAVTKAALVDINPVAVTHRNIVLMILFTMVTFGLYVPIWFIRRRRALNALDSPRRLALWPPVAFALVVAAALGTEVVAAAGENVPGAFVLYLARAALAIVMLVQAFKTKDILEDHLAGPPEVSRAMFAEEPVKFSGTLTFLFSIFYLQHIINTRVVGTVRRRGDL